MLDNMSITVHTLARRGCPRGVMVKAMDCGIVVREFVLQSRYYVHFRANTLGKGMNPLILPAGPAVRVFANGPGFNPRSSHTKDFKNGT